MVIGSLRLDFNLGELYTQQAAESPGIAEAIISYQTPASWTLHCKKLQTPQIYVDINWQTLKSWNQVMKL